MTSSGPAAVGEDRRVKRDIQDPVAAFVANAAANVLAQTEVDLQCQRNDVRLAESNCGNLLADSMLAAANRLAPWFGAPAPQIAFQNGGGIRGEADVPAGPFTEATAFQLAAFSTNFVAVVTVPAETFHQILEEGAVGLPAAADGGFVQIAGARYTVDTTRPARQTAAGVQTAPGQRITSVVLDDGTVLVADGLAADVDVTIASNNFSLTTGSRRGPHRHRRGARVLTTVSPRPVRPRCGPGRRRWTSSPPLLSHHHRARPNRLPPAPDWR